MLTVNNEAQTTSDLNATRTVSSTAPSFKQGWLTRALRIEWLGQMVASLCWIISVFSYGIKSTGDWLQLAAACSWMIANVAAILSDDHSDKN